MPTTACRSCAGRRDQAGMVVGHDQFAPPEAAPLQRHEEVLPGRAALAIGHLPTRGGAPPARRAVGYAGPNLPSLLFMLCSSLEETQV